MKKAQAAMEFLMTYGWAILIVLIAIGALMFYIKPSEILPEKCVISSGSGLFCEKWSADVGQIDLKIKNSLDETLTITTASYITDGTSNCTVALDTAIAASESAPVTFSGGSCSTLAASGEKIQGDIALVIRDADAFNKTSAGTLIVKVP